MSIYFGDGGMGVFRKESAKKSLKSQRMALGILLFGLMFINLGLSKYALPQISELTTSTSSISWLSLLLGLMGGYVIFGDKNNQKIDETVKKYKEGELIPVSELIDWRYDIVGILLITGTVMIWIYSIIMPMYSLTNSF